MADKPRLNAGTAVQNQLEELALELNTILDDKRQLEAREKAIKAEIALLANSYRLPLQEGASEYLNLPTINKALQIVQPEPTVSILDPEEMRRRLGCDTFHKVAKIRTVEFLAEAWMLLRDEERVRDTDLEGLVTSRDNAVRIGFQKARPQ